jgi:hypothetical protein
MGMSAMVRAVLYGTVLVSACFDDLSAVRQLGFESGISWVLLEVCVVAVYGAESVHRPMGLAGGVLCRLSMTDARFGVLQQKLCLVVCYCPLPW